MYPPPASIIYPHDHTLHTRPNPRPRRTSFSPLIHAVNPAPPSDPPCAYILQTSTRPPQKPSTPTSIDTRSRTKDPPIQQAGARTKRSVHFPAILEVASSPESMAASQPMLASQVTNGQKPTVYDSAYIRHYVTHMHLTYM